MAKRSSTEFPIHGLTRLTNVLVDHEGRVWIGRVQNLYVLNLDAPSDLSPQDADGARHLDQLARKQAPSSEAVQLPVKPGEIFEYHYVQVTLSGRAKILYQTADSHIWISNANSLVEFDGRFFKDHEGVRATARTRAMVEDSSGNLWLGGANGLVRLDRSGLISYANGLKRSLHIVTINKTRAGPFTLPALQ